MKSNIIKHYIILLLSIAIIPSCRNGRTAIEEQLDLAENLMTYRPDSSLITLNRVTPENLGNGEIKARYALLKSMALDKNYIDTTTFDILQPAIDYYLKKGTPDEKMRTYYYQGRIFQNQQNSDMAMQSFIKARELSCCATDTLVLANLLIAQGTNYYSTYKIDEFIQNSLLAAHLYKAIDRLQYEFTSLAKALDGSILSKNQHLADSILIVAKQIVEKQPEFGSLIIPYILSYTITFGTDDEIKDALDYFSMEANISDEAKLDMALGYLKIEDPKRALTLLKSVSSNEEVKKSLKYLSIKPDILEANADYRNALEAYRQYSNQLEEIHKKLFTQDLLFAQEKHDLEMISLTEIQEKDKLIWFTICCTFALLIVVGLIYYRYRIGCSKRIIAEQENTYLRLKQEKLQKENETLELEKQNVKLECEQQILAKENLQMRILQLESESENLKNLLSNQEELSGPIAQAIKTRIEMLNGLLAAQITENDTYAKSCGLWLDKILKDKNAFMDSTRLAFKASHPKFIKYLEEHGLSEYEMNYLCLYAIGLRGKDIGEYIQLKRHYHISSDIRKKLGIDEHETNIGIYVRKLMKEL